MLCISTAMGEPDAQEVQIMQQCSFDRNIVQFYGFCPSPPMLVLEFMEVCWPLGLVLSFHAQNVLCLAIMTFAANKHPFLA